jgi:hypothetical protein
MTTATLDTIDALEALPVKIQYVAEVPSKWDESTLSTVDQWRVTISSKAGFHSFDYFTGLGLRTQIPALYLAHNPPRKGTLAYEQLEKAHRKPKAPKVADVLHSLIMDSSAADENFHDWCENYGYSDDSIKAMNTYKSCLETAVALRKHFSPDTLRQVRELLQDH